MSPSHRLLGRLLPALALAGLTAAPAAAQVRPDSGAAEPREVGAVVVTGTRAPAVVGGASAVQLRLDSLRLPPAPTAEQALRLVPFVLVRQNSRGEAELSVRGSDSRQMAVLLDGIPLTLGWDHRTDPSLLPLTGVAELSVVRGLGSLLDGPNVLGGVISLDVAGAVGRVDRPATTLSMGVDGTGSRVASAGAAGAADVGDGRLGMRVGLGWRDRPGVALARGVADLAPDDGRRTNSDLRQLDAMAAAAWHSRSGAWVGATAAGYDARRGVPPELHVEEPRLWREPRVRRGTAVLSAGTGVRRTPLGAATFGASVGVTGGALEIEQFDTPAYAQPVGRERGDERTVTARVRGTQRVGAGELALAATLAHVRYDERLDDDPMARYAQRLWSVAAEGNVGRGRTQLVAGAALDGASTPATGGRPALGAREAWAGRVGVSTLAGDRVRLHAALGTRARFPALRELYSGALGRFEPNPDLRPERLATTEAGVTAQVGAMELQGVVFHHRLEDAVVRTTTADGRFRRENRDEMRSTGVELLADWQVGGVALQGDATLQRVRLRDAIAGAGRRPEHQPGVRLGLEAAAPAPFGLVLRGGARYVGRQWCVHPDLGRDVALDGTLRGDVAVERGWSFGGSGLLRTARAVLGLDNVGDAAVYDQCGLPQAGRTLRLGVELR